MPSKPSNNPFQPSAPVSFRWPILPPIPQASKGFRWEMNASQKQNRWVNSSIWLVYSIPLLVLLSLASSPLWYVREVMYPQTPQERDAYQSEGVRVPYALLCTVGAIASGLCLPMLAYILHLVMRGALGLNTTGDAMAIAGCLFATCLLVSAILVVVMLPLYVTYRYHISPSETTDTTDTPTTMPQHLPHSA
jgi:uncharacterized membrane protein YesL